MKRKYYGTGALTVGSMTVNVLNSAFMSTTAPIGSAAL